MKRLAFILMFISTVCFGATVDISTQDYEGAHYNAMIAAQYPDTSYDIGGPGSGFGMLYVGNKYGSNALVDEETDGEYSYQGVLSFRITPGDVPIGVPITDVKLGLSIQDVSFPEGSQIWIHPIKRNRGEGTLMFPTWNRLHLLTPLEWANVTAGHGLHWLLAHTSPIDILQTRATILSAKTSTNDEEYTYYEVDVDSVFSGLLPTHGSGDPIDVSFLLMSGTNNSMIWIDNTWIGRDDPIYLRLTYDGNPIPTKTATNTPGSGHTPTFTPTVATPTPTNTNTVTATPTNTGNTPTATPTFTGASATPTPTVTKTYTPSATSTATPSNTVTQTRTNTTGATQTPTSTFTLTPTFTTIPTETSTNTSDGSDTPTVTATWTTTRTMTPSPTYTTEPTPTGSLPAVALFNDAGYTAPLTNGYIESLTVKNLTAENFSADKSTVSIGELFLEGGISVTRSGFTVGPGAQWQRQGTLKLDDDTYLTKDGLLYLEGPKDIASSADYWNAVTGVIATDSTTRTGTLQLGQGNAGFELIGTNTTSGKLEMGSDLFIELDVTDAALEFDNQNTSLRDPNAHLHFGAEQGGTGYGESFIKWNTTENQFTIGDYTYPAPGSIPSVTIDTDTNSMIIGGDLTVMGTILGVEPVSIVNASQVTAGTFGDGSYVFQDNLTFSGTDPQLIFPNSDAIRYTNATALLDFYNGSSAALSFDLDGGFNAIGASASASYKLYVVSSGSSGTDTAGYFNNTKTEEAAQYGIQSIISGAHGTGINYGAYVTATGSTVSNRGITSIVSGSGGATNISAHIQNTCTDAGTKYGAHISATGANGTNRALYANASGAGTNWAGYFDGGNVFILNTLQLADTGQQITVDTSANTFKFGNSSTADQFTIDTDNGNITFAGSMNPGSEFTVTGQLGYYDGTTFKGIASVGNDGEVLASQGAGLPPVFEAVAGAHDAVTLDDDPYDYLSIASQVITLGQVDLATDVTGTLDESLIDADITRDTEIDDILLVTASRAVVSSATGKLTASAVTATELGYLSGVTSAVQTQLNAKAASTYTANRAMQSNASTGALEVSSTVDTTELSYLNGVTSAIQTQINAKQATITGSATTIDTETLTASRALQTDGSGKVAVSSTVDTTELGYLDGVTSAIQTQIAGKQATITGSATTVDTETLTASRAVQTDGSGKLAASSTIDTTELGYLNGVSSNIQTQLDGKLSAITGSASSIDTETLTASRAMVTDAGGLVAVSASVDSTELGYLDGVSSAIQTQLNAKNATITGSASSVDTETLTASRAIQTGVGGLIEANASVTTTELGYLDGVTSAIQTQIAGKQATITGSATTIDTETLSASMAMETDGTGKVAASSTVSSTELGYLDGVTSAIQTQIASKQATITGSATTVDTETLTASRAVQTSGTGKLEISSTVDTTELGYLNGVTSAIQTQINTKEPTVTKGNLSETTSAVLTITGGDASVIGSGTTIQVKQAATGQSGYLSSTDWNTFNGKQPLITGSATTVDTETLTASRALSTDGSGKIAAVSAVDTTELGYLDGVTSAIQTQIAAKQATITGSATTVDTETLNTSMAMETNGAGKIAVSSTVSSTELGYVDGATATIQTQLNGKAATLHNQGASTITAGTFGAGNYTFPDNFVIQDYAAIGTTVTTGRGLNIITAPTDTEGYALYARANGVNATHVNVGVVGVATNSSIQNYGVDGIAYGASGETKGVNATTYGTGTSQTHYAVDAYSYGSGGTSTTNIGIRARATGGTTANWAGYFGDGDVSIQNTVNIGAGSAVDISSSAITVTKSRHSVTDTLSVGTFHTINGGTSGDILYLCGTSGDSIVVQDRVEGAYGNIQLDSIGPNPTLDSGNDWLMLLYDGTYWQLISSAINN